MGCQTLINSSMLLFELTDEEIDEKIRQKNLKRIALRRANPKPFDASTTDMPMYDDMLKDPEYAKQKGHSFEVEWMRPDDYIQQSAEGFGSSYNRLQQTRMDTGKVGEYAGLLRSGHTFPMLVLHTTGDKRFTQEGLHRAFAAKEVGFEKVPVMIVKTEGSDQSAPKYKRVHTQADQAAANNLLNDILDV